MRISNREDAISLGTWKVIGRGLASDQLRMRAISHCKHAKLKNTNIYSKGALVYHTKLAPMKISRYTVHHPLNDVIILCSIIGQPKIVMFAKNDNLVECLENDPNLSIRQCV
jgi:hypothetical protein